MALFSITDAQLAFGHVALLDHADFALEAGERVGLIGRNGTGKSTLLKIVAGCIQPDDGLISRQSELRTAYVEQEPELAPDLSVFEAVAQGVGDTHAGLVAYEQIAAQLGEATDEAEMERLLERMHVLQAELDASDAWSLKTRVDALLNRLGLPAQALIGTLSGGTLKRVALAQALVMQPDVLLLDEPTNHLDITSIGWLEDLLIGFNGSVLLITHDRAFLDRVATRIVELDRGRLISFPGNFSTYQARKAQLLENEAIENAKFDKLLAQEEVWIRKGVEARRTRSVGRVARLQEMRQQRVQRREVQGNVQLEVAQAERSGKIIADLKNVSQHYGGKAIIRNFTATLMRGDKIGLIGPNGAGKTTLLKLILGELEPESGTVKTGTSMQVAYFDQMRTQLDPDLSLMDTISPGSDWVEINGQKKHVMSYLSDFLFAPERARSPVKSLSGGERNRLLLARLFARPANVLVLDEPTNDLDIATLELLEELLQDFGGTVFLVSHDRAFLDNVVTSVIVAEGEGAWREYVGGYQDWLQQSARAAALRVEREAQEQARQIKGNASAATPGPTSASVAAPPPVASRANKLSYKERRELESLPAQMEALETEQKQVMAELADGSIFAKDPARGRQLADRHENLEIELLVLLERLESLESRA